MLRFCKGISALYSVFVLKYDRLIANFKIFYVELILILPIKREYKFSIRLKVFKGGCKSAIFNKPVVKLLLVNILNVIVFSYYFIKNCLCSGAVNGNVILTGIIVFSRGKRAAARPRLRGVRKVRTSKGRMPGNTRAP
jgi:hypothetical protein